MLNNQQTLALWKKKCYNFLCIYTPIMIIDEKVKALEF